MEFLLFGFLVHCLHCERWRPAPNALYVFLTVLWIGSRHLSCGLVDFRFFLKVFVLFSKPWVWPFNSFRHSDVQKLFILIYTSFLFLFCNDKDILFGLQSESELSPTFLVPSLLLKSCQVPSWPSRNTWGSPRSAGVGIRRWLGAKAQVGTKAGSAPRLSFCP